MGILMDTKMRENPVGYRDRKFKTKFKKTSHLKSLLTQFFAAKNNLSSSAIGRKYPCSTVY
jgi:hypothetical protein